MNELPVWLLDIDGVLNADSRKPPRHVWPADQWISGQAEAHGHRWPILAARPVADFIRTIHDRGLAEIRWHTTWQTDATNLAKLLDLPDFPVQHAPEYLADTIGGWWKLPAAQRVAELEGRPLVWTDDDADDPSNLPPIARTALAATVPILIIAPSPLTGLTPRQLRRIAAFLRLDATARRR